MISANFAETVTAYSTFATALVVAWNARHSRQNIDAVIEDAYRPELVIEVYNLSDKKITVKEINYIFKKPKQLIPYYRLSAKDCSSFSLSGGDRARNSYTIMYADGNGNRDHDWRHLCWIEIKLSSNKVFKFKISNQVKKFLSANEDYFEGSHWNSFGQPGYAQLMEKKMYGN